MSKLWPLVPATEKGGRMVLSRKGIWGEWMLDFSWYPRPLSSGLDMAKSENTRAGRFQAKTALQFLQGLTVLGSRIQAGAWAWMLQVLVVIFILVQEWNLYLYFNGRELTYRHNLNSESPSWEQGVFAILTHSEWLSMNLRIGDKLFRAQWVWKKLSGNKNGRQSLDSAALPLRWAL